MDSVLVQETPGDWTVRGGRRLRDRQILDAAAEILFAKLARSDAMTSPDVTRRYLMSRLHGLEHEVFCVLFLDTRHRALAFEEMFRGTLDGASVYPREVVKAALRHNAAAVIIAHNHPSGEPEPSRADEALTQRLREALALMDIRLLDHFVIGTGLAVSFAERGLL